jgi:hypothetical protein
MWLDPATAKRVSVRAFVMVLSCSRHLFVRPLIRIEPPAGKTNTEASTWGIT